MSSVMLPPAAAATAMTLSRLMTRSAMRIVLIAVSRCSLASMSSPPSSGTSSLMPIQKSSRLPTSFSHGSASILTANMVRPIRSTTAAPAPQKIACFCCLGGSERAASAITTALSPERTMLTPMIFSRPTQNAWVASSSSMNSLRKKGILEQADDFSVDEVDFFRRGNLGQARHGHDVPADHHHELGAGGEPHLAHVDDVVGRRAAHRGIHRDRSLRLRHAHRIVAVAVVLQLLDLRAHPGIRCDLGRAVDFLRDLGDLVPERVRVLVHERGLGGLVAQADDDLRE